jgi:hypothetical protein
MLDGREGAMTTASRPRRDGLEEYRERQEREDARLRAVYQNREFFEAAREGIARWLRGDRTGTTSLEQFAEEHGLPSPP